MYPFWGVLLVWIGSPPPVLPQILKTVIEQVGRP